VARDAIVWAVELRDGGPHRRLLPRRPACALVALFAGDGG